MVGIDTLLESEEKEGRNFLGQYQVPIYLVLGGLILVALGILLFSLKNQDEVKVQTVAQPEKVATVIVVDLAGAVEKPGVYQLPAEARMNDLLIKAGGLAAEADRDWVQQNLNLAQKLTDGTKIWIPKKGETKILNGVATVAGSSGQVANVAATAQVNINAASAAELDSLPGVGEARATAIISNRPYASIDELVAKKVIPKGVFDKIKDKIAVY